VDAILEATLQVLIEVGKARLTTTRVANRAGVSVGTLYQYFPNKSAALQAVLERHLNEVTAAVEAACEANHGSSLETMATALMTTFFDAKLRNARYSRALHAVSDDIDGDAVVQRIGHRITRAIAAMLETAPEGLNTEPRSAAMMLQSAMTGAGRRMVDGGLPEREVEILKRESIVLARAYLLACARERE